MNAGVRRFLGKILRSQYNDMLGFVPSLHGVGARLFMGRGSICCYSILRTVSDIGRRMWHTYKMPISGTSCCECFLECFAVRIVPKLISRLYVQARRTTMSIFVDESSRDIAGSDISGTICGLAREVFFGRID